jgi:hypothetical protein
MLGVAGDAVLVLRRHTRRHGLGGSSTRACRRAVARRRAWLVAELRAVEELASLSQLAGGEFGRMVKIFKCAERSRSSMMDVEDEHNHMRAAFGLRDRIGQPGTPAAVST